MDQDMKTYISTLVKNLSDKKDILTAIIGILAENKKSVDKVATDAQSSIEEVLNKITDFDEQVQVTIKSALESLAQDYELYSQGLKDNTSVTKDELQAMIKAQNDRAFKRMQGLFDQIKMVKDGTPGKDGANADPAEVVPLVMALIKLPEFTADKAEQIRDKLEELRGDERIDISAIKGVERFFGRVTKKSKQILVGGIRFFENLADVSIIPTHKRDDMIAQYKTLNNRWEDGVALTVGTTQPASPREGDLWVDTN